MILNLSKLLLLGLGLWAPILAKASDCFYAGAIVKCKDIPKQKKLPNNEKLYQIKYKDPVQYISNSFLKEYINNDGSKNFYPYLLLENYNTGLLIIKPWTGSVETFFYFKLNVIQTYDKIIELNTLYGIPVLNSGRLNLGENYIVVPQFKYNINKSFYFNVLLIENTLSSGLGLKF